MGWTIYWRVFATLNSGAISNYIGLKLKYELQIKSESNKSEI